MERAEFDPVYLHARREAWVIFLVWLAALLWCVPYCYVYGYSELPDPAQLSTVWGIPSWLFWGIVAPWLVADLLTVVICFAWMRDESLGVAGDEAESDAEQAPSRPPHSGRSQEGDR